MEKKMLVFLINNEKYATDIVDVERILGYEEPTRLPDLPAFAEGVINHEGNILSIVSLAKRFNVYKEPAKDPKIVVIMKDDFKLGVLVDGVSEVINVNEENIEEPPNIVSGVSKRYISGLIKENDKIIILLNIAAILTDEEKRLI